MRPYLVIVCCDVTMITHRCPSGINKIPGKCEHLTLAWRAKNSKVLVLLYLTGPLGFFFLIRGRVVSAVNEII